MIGSLPFLILEFDMAIQVESRILTQMKLKEVEKTQGGWVNITKPSLSSTVDVDSTTMHEEGISLQSTST